MQIMDWVPGLLGCEHGLSRFEPAPPTSGSKKDRVVVHGLECELGCGGPRLPQPLTGRPQVQEVGGEPQKGRCSSHYSSVQRGHNQL